MGEKKEKIVIYGYLMIIIVLIVIRFVMLDIVEQENYKLIQLKEDIRKQRNNNLLINEQFLHQDSYQYISEQAKKRGFSERWRLSLK